MRQVGHSIAIARLINLRAFSVRLFAMLPVSISLVSMSVAVFVPSAPVGAQPTHDEVNTPLTELEKNNPSGWARRFIGERKFRRALLIVRHSLARHSDNKHPMHSIGDWRLDPSGQELAFRELTAEQLRLIDCADMYNLEGMAQQGLGDSSAAEASFRKAVVLNPYHGLAYANLGAILVQRQKLDEALVQLNKALQISERYDSAYRTRSVVYRSRNQFDKERKDIESSDYWHKRNGADDISLSFLTRFEFVSRILAKKTTARNLVALGVVNREECRLSESSKCFLAAIKLDAKMPEAHWAYGQLLYMQKKFKAAIAEFNLAQALDSGAVLVYYGRARAYLELHQSAPAIADYSKIIALPPKPDMLMESYFYRSCAYGEMKQYALAIKDLDKAMTYYPAPHQKAIMFSSRGSMYEALGKKEQAIKDYEAAMAIEPGNKIVYGQRGKLMLTLGEYEQATFDLNTSKAKTSATASNEPPSNSELRAQIAHYDKLIAMFPGKAIDSLYSRGLLYLTMGDGSKAAADMQSVLLQAKDTNDTADSAACYANIALRMQKKEAEAAKLLDDYNKRPRSQRASEAVRVYLFKLRPQREDMLILDGPKQKTRYLTLRGLDFYIRGNVTGARRCLTLVRNIGQSEMDEFALAMAYLKRLGLN